MHYITNSMITIYNRYTVDNDTQMPLPPNWIYVNAHEIAYKPDKNNELNIDVEVIGLLTYAKVYKHEIRGEFYYHNLQTDTGGLVKISSDDYIASIYEFDKRAYCNHNMHIVHAI